MLDIIIDTFLDSVKLLPFLFLAYLLIEYIEHKSSSGTADFISKFGRFGAIPGALLGIIPQCGFSVAAANLYLGGIVTAGTLAAVFLSTSDEAVILLLANPEYLKYALMLMAYKVFIGMGFGLLYDFFQRNAAVHVGNKDLCRACDCGHGILRASVKHTVSIFIYITAVSFVINVLIHYLGDAAVNSLLLNGSVFQPLLTAIIGFVPGCAVSVTLSELFMSGKLAFGSILAGLCTNAGLGLLVLFKSDDRKDILKLMLYMYAVSSIVGIVVNFLRI